MTTVSLSAAYAGTYVPPTLPFTATQDVKTAQVAQGSLSMTPIIPAGGAAGPTVTIDAATLLQLLANQNRSAAASTITLPDGSKYTGQLKDGKPHGQGILIYSMTGQHKPQRERYEGEFQNGVPHGQGVVTCTNGFKYEGNWENDYQNGYGKSTSPDYRSYEGMWKNGLHDGNGKKIFNDGSLYAGEFRDNRPNGKGKYSKLTGYYYDGMWKDGEFHGEGIQYIPGIATYRGVWKNDKKDGQFVVDRFYGGAATEKYLNDVQQIECCTIL